MCRVMTAKLCRKRPSPLASGRANGFIMDARYVPREIQEVAFAKGLIPYIPSNRK